VSLLDRGFVYAIAQIAAARSSDAAGTTRPAAREAQQLHGFHRCHRISRRTRYADPQRVFARGGSAGGLLMGAVINMAPQLYRGIVAHVPFVDVVTTMLDATLPLTTNEYDEWGNPNEKPFYDYMLTYSPYDNVRAQAYPALYVTTGLWDSQVQYFEPAKWVARLRRLKTDTHPVLFKINMEAGHGGKSVASSITGSSPKSTHSDRPGRRGDALPRTERGGRRAGQCCADRVRRGCASAHDRKAALAHQRRNVRVATAERAVSIGRIDRVADREHVLAQTFGDGGIPRPPAP
jgi:hypothetical protein